MRPALLAVMAATLVSLVETSAFADCANFGADGPAIRAVQASWGPAELLMRDGKYAQARAKLERTAALLPRIADAFSRSCVAGGADIRLTKAIIGENYLRANPKDVAGARDAAERAWRSFPSTHNCP